MKKIILIKLGGSLITDKDIPYTAKPEIIQHIAKELKSILVHKKDTLFLLGNGAGSFGHYPAVKYAIKNGIKTQKQVFGFAVVQDGVARLNRLVVQALLSEGVPAVSLHPSSYIIAKNGKKKYLFTKSLFGFLDNNIIPVIYGDIVVDETVGCHIFSTEDQFSLLIPELIKHNYTIEKIIHLTSVAGVLDEQKQIIPFISSANFLSVKKKLFNTHGFDVTGGMLHKIKTALVNAQKNIPTYIGKGDAKGNTLLEVIMGGTFLGTTIRNNKEN